MFRKSLIAVALSLVSGVASAATCSIDINSNDAMQFDTKSIEVSKQCTEFTVNLHHVGKMPKNVMGHNWVLVKTPDLQGVSSDGLKAGLASDYLKADDSRIIAHTKLIGGGETDSITFPISALNGTDAYTFFCSFPGHQALMKGTLKLVD
ncbi:azurin [Alcaligenaceae bacterium SJ-26]|nr:azurin [Alcaligenaceae bacterium SJ-26]